MKFEQIIQELGDELSIGPLELDENNQVTLTFDDNWNLTFELDEMNNELLVFLPIHDLQEEMFDNPQVFKALNNRFCLGASSAGFALCFLEKLDCGALWRRYRNDFHGKDEIIAIASRMLDVANDLLRQLPSLGSADSLPSDFRLSDDLQDKFALFRQRV